MGFDSFIPFIPYAMGFIFLLAAVGCFYLFRKSGQCSPIVGAVLFFVSGIISFFLHWLGLLISAVLIVLVGLVILWIIRNAQQEGR